jgi:hypothetical protein
MMTGAATDVLLGAEIGGMWERREGWPDEWEDSSSEN